MSDKITLKDAMGTPAWMIIYATEPLREVDVTMTYANLKTIHDFSIWLKRLWEERNG